MMDVTALGGPHDGDVIAIADGIKSIRFMVLPESAAKMLESDTPDAFIDTREVTYQVERYHTGRDDTNNPGRMLMVVLAPGQWPKAGHDKPLYHPWQRRGI